MNLWLVNGDPPTGQQGYEVLIKDFHFYPAGPMVPRYGDISGNGEITAYDASLAAQYAVRLIELTPQQIMLADVTGNGAVSATDAAWIAKRAVDPTVVFPVEEAQGAVFTRGLEPTMETYVTVTVGDGSGAPGDVNIEIPITVSDVTGSGTIGVDLDLQYDATQLSFAETSTGGTIVQNGGHVCNKKQPGAIRVVLYNTQPMVGQGRLLNTYFDIDAQATGGTTPLHLTKADFNEGAVPSVLEDGVMTIAGSQQEYWPPDMVEVDPAAPTPGDEVGITLAGNWGDSCTPNGSSISVSGNSIYFDVIHDYPVGTGCLQVITPWSQTEQVGPLAAGTYGVYARLISQSSPKPYMQVGQFTVSAAGDYTIGGAIYSDLANPLTSGVEGVLIVVSGAGGTFQTTTAGAQGLWRIADVPQGTYSVTPQKTCTGFQRVIGGVLEEWAPITIVVNEANQQVNQSIQFLAVEPPAFTIGGAVYTDLGNPLTSGLAGVTVTVTGECGTFEATTAGPGGLWQLADVPEGSYTVTPNAEGNEFQHVAQGVPDGQTSITIVVSATNEADNQSIQFLAHRAVLLHDWNGDGIISIVGDVPPFVDCVYFGTCPPQHVELCDCNGDGLCTIVGDVPCFVDCVYFGNCPN